MIILDTDHINILQTPGPTGNALAVRLNDSVDQDFATTVITVEEQMRGWLAVIHRHNDVYRQLPAYDRLGRLFIFNSRWKLAAFNGPAADEFQRLWAARIRISTMDLKIASIARVNGALLLTANLRDFEQVPNLRLENWLV